MIKTSKSITCHRRKLSLAVLAVAALGISYSAWSAIQNPGIVTGFTNVGSIANTRHNLTQGGMHIAMDGVRNNYGEVCVYCHTPHGANLANGLKAPLWNRTIRATNYQTYDQLGTTSLMGHVSQPGSASLTCLSCHDGQTAVDSIINMPGSGMGLLSQATSQNVAFLDTWKQPPAGSIPPQQHQGLNSTASSSVIPGIIIPPITYPNPIPGQPPLVFPGIPYPGYGAIPAGYTTGNGTGSDNVGCLTCHSTTGFVNQASAGANNVIDMSTFLIGTDLRNDHPVGIDFPIALANTPGSDWNKPNNVQGSSLYFENNDSVNGRMDKAEIRLYDGKVECASCHDPHGVPSGGPGTNTVFNKTFLRKQNTDTSKVCLTCHNK
ncbi:MAG: hypothetical protein WA632_08380 [Gallionella sp.]